MKWYHYLICAVLIVVGVIGSISLVQTFNVKSGEYGSVVIFDRAQDYDTFSHFDLTGIGFESEDFVNYKLTYTDVPQRIDGTKNEYGLLFNNKPLNNVTQTAGVVSGDFELNFYDLQGEVVSTAKLHVVVEYSVSATTVTITTVNQSNSISYLNVYVNVENALLDVIVKGVK